MRYCRECDQLYAESYHERIHDEPVRRDIRRCEDCGSKLELVEGSSNRAYEAGYAYACGYHD